MGGGKRGNFGNTYGSRMLSMANVDLDAISDLLTAASLIPGLDTFADLAAIPIDLARGDFVKINIQKTIFVQMAQSLGAVGRKGVSLNY